MSLPRQNLRSFNNPKSFELDLVLVANRGATNISTRPFISRISVSDKLTIMCNILHIKYKICTLCAIFFPLHIRDLSHTIPKKEYIAEYCELALCNGDPILTQVWNYEYAIVLSEGSVAPTSTYQFGIVKPSYQRVKTYSPKVLVQFI